MWNRSVPPPGFEDRQPFSYSNTHPSFTNNSYTEASRPQPTHQWDAGWAEAESNIKSSKLFFFFDKRPIDFRTFLIHLSLSTVIYVLHSLFLSELKCAHQAWRQDYKIHRVEMQIKHTGIVRVVCEFCSHLACWRFQPMKECLKITWAFWYISQLTLIFCLSKMHLLMCTCCHVHSFLSMKNKFSDTHTHLLSPQIVGCLQTLVEMVFKPSVKFISHFQKKHT